MKKVFIIPIIITFVVFGFIIAGLILGEAQYQRLNKYDTEVIELGTLYRHIDTDGYIVSNQTAILFWQINGEVDNVYVRPGYQVTEGSILASLGTDSTPPHIISARAEIVTAQLALDILQNSQLQQSQASKALDNAQKQLEDAFRPEEIQAQALEKVANAQETLDIAQRNYEIATAINPQSSIDQAFANMILAEHKVASTEELLAKLNSQYIRIGANADLLEQEQIEDLQSDIKDAIKQVEFLLIQDRRSYENSVVRYNELLKPPDTTEIAVAESDLALAKAQLNEAEKEWNRIKDGISPADLAVYEAELNEALRRWERIKDGPHPDDLSIIETRITAAEAAIKQMDIATPFDGTVTSVRTSDNDIVYPGTLAFQVDDLSRIFINLTVTEIDIARIEIGQEVIIRLDAVPGKEYHGKVSAIAMVGNKILGATSFKVTAEILDADDEIRLGMTTNALIIVDEISGVLLIPNSAIRGLNGDLIVYRLNIDPAGSLIPLFRWETGSSAGGGFKFPLTLQQPVKLHTEPITITLGTQSSGYSEVLNGNLQAGDTIILNPPVDQSELSN